MRWLRLDPPWLIFPVVAGMVLAAAVVSNDGPWLLIFGFTMVSVLSFAFGADRWLERNRPRQRERHR